MYGSMRWALLLWFLTGTTSGLAASVEGARPASVPSRPDAGPGYHIVDRIPMTDGWWDYVSFDPVHRRLFVARGNGVFKLDIDTGLMDPRIVPGSEGRAVAVLPGGEQVLATVAGYSAAILFAANDGRVSKMFKLRQPPDAAVWEPVGKRVWVMGGSGEATLIDPVRLEKTDVIDLGEELEFAVADGKGHVFVNATESAAIIAVDAASRRVIGRWKMKGCEDPSGLAYSEAAGALLSVCANKMLKVVDAHTGSELATIDVGAGADAVIYDEASRRAFVPSAIDGLLTVLQDPRRTL